MLIRKAKKVDIPSLIKLSKLKEFQMPNGSFPDKKYFEDSLTSSLFFVAEENKKVLGFIKGFKLTKDLVYLDLLTVDNKARGKGIGKKLIEKFKKELKKKQITEYFLFAPVFNKKTCKFYEKLGLTKGKKYFFFCEKI